MKRIIVVGGGTTGAFACGLIKSQRPDYQVVNIKSTDIPIIGVGESTTPIFIKVCNDMGITDEFFKRRDCVWPKYGVKFVDWNDKPHRGGWSIDSFHTEVITFLYGLTKGEYLGRLDHRIDQGLIPYNKEEDSFFSVTASHIDATETSNFIFEKFADRIETVSGTVTHVETGEQGIEWVLVNNKKITGDVYIDCTGFARRLIGELTTDFIASGLPVNSAVYLPIAYNQQPHDFWTTATAGKAGWIWNIPFEHRNGTGYVYNKDFITRDQAAVELAEINHADPANVQGFSFTGGWLNEPYTGNCVAMGMAAGFLDALDANTLHITFRQIYSWLRNEDSQQGYNNDLAQDYSSMHDYIQIYYKNCHKQTEYWNSVPKYTESEMEDRFLSLFEGTYSEYDLSGFTQSITARIIANRIKIRDQLAAQCLKKYDIKLAQHALQRFNKLKDMYVPWDREIWIKNMKAMNLEWQHR